jgi:hypothetical protein
MSARIVDSACVAVPLLGAGLTEDGIVGDPRFAEPLRRALHALEAVVAEFGRAR